MSNIILGLDRLNMQIFQGVIIFIHFSSFMLLSKELSTFLLLIIKLQAMWPNVNKMFTLIA